MRYLSFDEFNTNPPVLKQYFLEKIPYQIRRQISQTILDQSLLRDYQDYITGNIIKEFTFFIAGQTIENVEERYPMDWWEAVKERWAPVWFLKRYPVKYRNIHIDVKALYPKIDLQDDDHFVRVERVVYPD